MTLRRDYRRDDWRRGCSPDRALDKAERMGLYRARIVGINRGTVKVMAARRRSRGGRVRQRARLPVIYR